jgi:hypothetical protein
VWAGIRNCSVLCCWLFCCRSGAGELVAGLVICAKCAILYFRAFSFVSTLRLGCLRRIFGPKRDEVTGSGEKYITRSVMRCTPHPVFG